MTDLKKTWDRHYAASCGELNPYRLNKPKDLNPHYEIRNGLVWNFLIFDHFEMVSNLNFEFAILFYSAPSFSDLLFTKTFKYQKPSSREDLQFFGGKPHIDGAAWFELLVQSSRLAKELFSVCG